MRDSINSGDNFANQQYWLNRWHCAGDDKHDALFRARNIYINKQPSYTVFEWHVDDVRRGIAAERYAGREECRSERDGSAMKRRQLLLPGPVDDFRVGAPPSEANTSSCTL